MIHPRSTPKTTGKTDLSTLQQEPMNDFPGTAMSAEGPKRQLRKNQKGAEPKRSCGGVLGKRTRTLSTCRSAKFICSKCIAGPLCDLHLVVSFCYLHQPRQMILPAMFLMHTANPFLVPFKLDSPSAPFTKHFYHFYTKSPQLVHLSPQLTLCFLALGLRSTFVEAFLGWALGSQPWEASQAAKSLARATRYSTPSNSYGSIECCAFLKPKLCRKTAIENVSC